MSSQDGSSSALPGAHHVISSPHVMYTILELVEDEMLASHPLDASLAQDKENQARLLCIHLENRHTRA